MNLENTEIIPLRKTFRIVLVDELKRDARIVLNILISKKNKYSEDMYPDYYKEFHFTELLRLVEPRMSESRLMAALGILNADGDITIGLNGPTKDAIEVFHVTQAGLYNHYADKYLRIGLMNWFNRAPVYISFLSTFIAAVALLGIDTSKMERKIETQQAQIDSLKKVMEPKPLLKPKPPYRQ